MIWSRMAWNKITYPGAIDAVESTFEDKDGLDVIIMIRKVGESFEVVSDAECRTSGPCVAVHGNAPTLSAARELLHRACVEWERSDEDTQPA